ncbi:pyridine nucleotide-disulfide oxidoreductase [Bradyrhizobium ontarionense]|uniref:Pyridine nucleotide-disulfide oxidoreductase n=1 Tax=Bradyrhizobium ontarionense TaxID=2898149 RepID=A0ABY3R937_9BRAD|nr:pyridine nucleotide-disulfide oxidoreductase [Bradyrhizobium sp. A19]UFZ03709.1 pyridine nucleotide-disulfide oxidoreductase [Bradyrhizobium sp. A19]
MTILVVGVIGVGWLQREEEYVTPGSGTGYWLGIYGSIAMLSLLTYSMRKRFKSLRGIGSVPFWFRTHMLLGVIGPVLILFHANFKLGALNSNVAFFAMLIVAISGVIGRYIYSKIHMGLHGGKARVKELLAEAEAMRMELGQEIQAASFVSRELTAFSKGLDNRVPRTALGSLRTGAIIAARTRRLRVNVTAEARRLIRAEGKRARWSWSERRRREKRIDETVRRYAAAVRKAAEMTFFERLFSLWHVLHLPLFFLMLLAGLVHVWAVHHY